MDSIVLALYIIMGINMLFYAGIAIFLIQRARKTKLNALYHLAFALLLIDICYIFYISVGSASVIYHIFRTSGIIWLTIFAQKAFNVNQKTLAPYIVGIGLVATVLTAIFYSIYINNGNGLFRSLSDLLFGAYTIISSLWQFDICRKAYSKMKNLSIEPYIKKRYELFQYSTLFLILTGIFGGCVAFAYDSILTVIIFLFVSLSSLGYLILNFLIWVMPPKFKDWLNRGFISTESDVINENTEENLSDEDIMAKFMEEDT